jgi:diaminopimelate epimerase
VERVYCIEEADCPLLQIEVYERGSGKTFSCGSGSVAVAYSYFKRKHGEIINGKKVMIKSDGGILQVEFKNNEAYLTGEIKEIYKGEIDEI